MKLFMIVVTACFVTLFYRTVLSIGEDAFTSVYQPLLNAGLVPLPGDIPVLNRKIYRGVRVTAQEHPYMASIRRLYSHYLCGVIISRNLILTIAHPLEDVPTYELGVVLGQSYSDRGTSLLPVILVIVHADFNPYQLTGDLAMLRLYANIVYRVNIKPILALAAPGQLYKDKKIFVTGWGRCDLTGKEMCFPRSSKYYPDEKVDPMLKTIYIKQKLNSDSDWLECSNLYKRAFEIKLNSFNRMLCLGYLREQFPSSPCMAVPGAAALIDARLLGLQSWGFGCGYKQDLPVVYTDVRKYYRWIWNTTKILHEIKTPNLTKLYHLTLAQEVFDWFSETRQYLPNRTQILDDDIQILPIDEKLALIQGNIYDIRDYVMDGKFHATKQIYYDLLNDAYNRNLKIKEIQKNVSEDFYVEPFIQHTIPTVESEDSDTGDYY